MKTEKFNLCKSTKKLLTLITLLTLGVGQMWADTDYGKQYLYFNGENFTSFFDASATPYISPNWANDCSNGGNNGGDKAMTQIGSSYAYYLDLSQSSGSYTYFKAFYIGRSSAFWDGACMGYNGNSPKNCIWAVGWGSYAWGYYAVPISSIALAASDNILSGSGTSGSPYLVPVGKSVTLTATPTSTPADGTMSFCANFGTSPSSNPTTVQSSSTYTVSSTSKTELKCIGRNKYGDVYSADVTSGSVFVQGVEPSPGVAAAGSITTSSATLNATITVNGATTTSYGFKYGTSSNRATLISSGTSASTSGALAADATTFSKGVTGLTANTTYYYVSFVTTASGTYYSVSTQSFTTLDDAETTHEVTIYYKYNSTDIKSSTTLDVGEETPSNVSSASITGYTFSSWSLGTGVDTEDDSDDDPISITTKASGSYTLQANYNINSYNVTFNAMSGSGSMSNESFNYNQTKALTSNAYTRDGYVFKGWATSSANATAGTVAYADGANYTMGSANVTLYAVWYKKAYFVNVPKWSAANIKAHVYKDATSWKTWNDAAEVMTSTGTTVFGYTIYSYEFPETYTTVKFHNNGDNETDAWTWAAATPYYYHGAGTQYASVAAIREAWKVYGSWNKDGSGNWKSNDFASYGATSATYTVSLAASTSYSFKYVFAGTNTWYGSGGGDMSDHDTWTLNGGSDVTFTSTVAGTYTFTITYSGMSSNSAPDCTVDFPVSYTVNFGVTPAAAADAPTNNLSISSGSLVASGTSITFTKDATPNSGYTWSHWEKNSSNVGSNNTYTTSITANTTVNAVYTENMHTVTLANGGHGHVQIGAATVTSTSAGIATASSTITAVPDLGYYFTGWTGDINNGVTLASGTASSTSITIRATADSKTITANFAPIWYLKGDFNSWGEGNPIALASATSGSVVLTTTSAKLSNSKFKIWNKQTGTYYQKANQSITRASNTASSDWTNGGSSNEMKFNSDVIGNYTYAVTFSSNIPSALTVTYPTAYTVTFGSDGHGTATASATSAGGSFSSGDYVASGDVVTFAQTPNTGYELKGWYTTAGGSTSAGLNGDNELTINAAKTVYAQYNAKTYTVTLDQQSSATGHGTDGDEELTATYDAAFPSATMPTAANGYAFMGYYSATGGGGTQFTDASGNLLANISGYSDEDGNWKYDDNLTLYAYYKKAEITALTFDAGTVEPGATVGVTPTIEPTPEGQKIICWTILYNNDTPLAPQPKMTWDGSKLTFNASAYSGTYKVQAVLRTGDACGAGDPLDTETASFLVAGSHSVTVNYKCSSDVIKTATSVTGRPTEWSDDITAPDIFGYTFSSWSSADGVTIKDSENEDVTSSTDATIKIKATYAGSLTANYTQNQMIFFKNTLGWENVYVNFYTASDWDNTDNGSGYPKGCGNNGLTNRNKTMTQYGETDIWYYDYEYNGGSSSITPTAYISFTDQSQNGVNEFWASNPGINVVYPANYADAISTDKSSENGFKAATPMFVPIAAQDPVLVNVGGGGRANYYNAGYWSKYTPGTGYVLEVYNSAGDEKLKTIEFESADDLMPMKAVADLEGGTTYKFQVRRGGESSAGVYYGNKGTMTYTNHGQDVAWDLTNTMSPSFTMAGITANAAGDYTFNLSYSAYHNESTDVDEYRLRIAVDYPVASGDYRLVYTDDVHTNPHPSAIVNKVNDGTDIVSFFVRHDQNPKLYIQQATVNSLTGAITWNEYPNSGTPTNQITSTIASTISSSGTEVYNFNLSMNGSGALTVASAEVYDGNFYIRTDAASSKWDNYRTDPDHRMIYSEYSIEHGGYTHYYTHWVDKDVTGRKNVKFCIANDYSPCISDTLEREEATGTWEHIADFMEEGGDLKRSANVRFMWDKRDNSISRAYVDGAQGDYSTNFLYMLNDEGEGADKIKKENGDPLTDHKVTFKDNGNWMYEANIKAQPDAQIKLLSNWGTSPTITQYFRGGSDATETLIGGSGSNWYDIRLIYDFKTNRLIAGLIPSGTIDEQMAIHADVMFVREHQGDIAQLTFAEKDSKMGAITDIETAFGVLQFNKWTLNNKSKESGHSPLSPLLSVYERDLFYVSFPFKVSMEEVFGFGTYGTHWIIEEYDGASRAANGYWLESGPNWKFVFNRKNKFFEPGQGYIIALDLDELGESSSIWANTDRVELYFPSYGTMDNITSSTATYEIPEHECTINRSNESNGHGGTLGPQYDRRVKDSHWNVLGVPTYVNPDAPNFANTAWTTSATETSIGPNFLYQWNMTDNTVSPVSASGYTYHAMHAYLVQYCGNVTWTSSVSVTPPSIVARRTYDEAPRSVEFRLELTQNDVAVDQTFVKLSDNEAVTTGFEFNYDLSKEFNKNRANIYTLIGTEQVAGNVLPLTDQTTVVPVGVQIATAGDYTFSLPDGTEGIGVTLIDNQTGIRTRLNALDYTVNLTAGTYDNRFVLEISPIHNATTAIEAISDEGLEISGARKVLIDGILYIVKGDKLYDVRGTMIK